MHEISSFAHDCTHTHIHTTKQKKNSRTTTLSNGSKRIQSTSATKKPKYQISTRGQLITIFSMHKKITLRHSFCAQCTRDIITVHSHVHARFSQLDEQEQKKIVTRRQLTTDAEQSEMKKKSSSPQNRKCCKIITITITQRTTESFSL